MSITVLVAADEPLIRAGLGALISAQPDLSVVGEAGDGTEVLPLVRELDPDVVLMDVRMPVMDGIEATRRLLAQTPDRPRILVITIFESDDYVYEALRARGQRLSAQARPGGRRSPTRSG